MDIFMKAALDEAIKSKDEGGIPIGAVLVKEGKIISQGHNRHIQENSRIFHAEIDCIRNVKDDVSLKNSVIYSTLMPCYFCAGAIIQFGISKVVSGETKHGKGSIDLLKSYKVEVEELDIIECVEILDCYIKNNSQKWREDCGVR